MLLRFKLKINSKMILSKTITVAMNSEQQRLRKRGYLKYLTTDTEKQSFEHPLISSSI